MGNALVVHKGDKEAKLAIVDTYKHIGTHCPINCGLGVEVHVRAGAVWGKLKRLEAASAASFLLVLATLPGWVLADFEPH